MTEEDYPISVDMLARIEPSHPLLVTCQEGYSKINVIYLRSALAGRVNEVEVARPQVQNEVREAWLDDQEYIDLTQRKSALFGRRFNISNQFHDHPGDPVACANISDEIRRVQLKIKTVFRQLAHYKATGEMLEDAPKVVREYEGLALGRRYRTVQQNVNRWRAKIKNDTATNADFITQQWDKTLKDYERQLASLRAQIDAESL
jgi:hypothetical protein